MLKKERFPFCFMCYVILLLMLVCLAGCTQKGQQSESRVDKTIRDMNGGEVFMKYVNSDDKLYYQMIASNEFMEQLDLQNWELDETGNAVDSEEYLVVRIAEKYEIVIYSNQVGKIYDYYGTYGTCDRETTFYKTTLNLQTIVDFLDQYAESLPYCNIGFEN